MASGKTLQMISLDRNRFLRAAFVKEEDKTPRDRSLRGKARRKARKAANHG